MDLGFGVVSKMSLPTPRSLEFFSMFSATTFIALHLTFVAVTQPPSPLSARVYISRKLESGAKYRTEVLRYGMLMS